MRVPLPIKVIRRAAMVASRHFQQADQEIPLAISAVVSSFKRCTARIAPGGHGFLPLASGQCRPVWDIWIVIPFLLGLYCASAIAN